jgi:F-type H+-transporting ATPase subunit a
MNISLAAEKVFELWGFPITNSMIFSWIVTILLITVLAISTRRLETIPSATQNFLEFVMESLLNLCNNVIENKEQTKRYFPLIATIFLFVMLNNWMGLLPGIGPIGIYEVHHGETVLVPLFRSGNADLNTTLAISIITMIAVQVFAVSAMGFSKHIKKFFDFRGPINFFVGILELISEFAKIISFSFRLFGNIFAGEVLLIVVAFLMPLIAPLPFLFLELFVGFIQALVFAMLALVFIKGATLAH